MTIPELKALTIKEYDKAVSLASAGSVLVDLTPIVKKCQIISFLTEESVSPNYEKAILDYFLHNVSYKK